MDAKSDGLASVSKGCSGQRCYLVPDCLLLSHSPLSCATATPPRQWAGRSGLGPGRRGREAPSALSRTAGTRMAGTAHDRTAARAAAAACPCRWRTIPDPRALACAPASTGAAPASAFLRLSMRCPVRYGGMPDAQYIRCRHAQANSLSNVIEIDFQLWQDSHGCGMTDRAVCTSQKWPKLG